MKATPQKFKISVEQEILYGEWMKKSAIEMGQQGKLPNMSMYQQQNQDRLTKQEQAYQIIKKNGVTNAKQLADQMGLNSKDHARNFIQRLIRDGKIERTNNPTTGCYPYKGYRVIDFKKA